MDEKDAERREIRQHKIRELLDKFPLSDAEVEYIRELLPPPQRRPGALEGGI